MIAYGRGLARLRQLIKAAGITPTTPVFLTYGTERGPEGFETIKVSGPYATIDEAIQLLKGSLN